MKRLPLILFAVHFGLASAVFGLSFTSPARAGLPLIITFIDFPASLLARWLSSQLEGDVVRRSDRLVEALIYTFIGSLWFMLIGVLVQKAFKPKPLR